MKVAIVGGVRPHVIKIAAFQRELMKYNRSASKAIETVFIHSGQHYTSTLADDLIEELGVVFDYRLSHSSQDPTIILAEMIKGIRSILQHCADVDRVVVIGDTNTTLAGAIAAVHSNIPVVHIESGIRSGDLGVIEEINRKAVDHMSKIHFCVTKSGVENLAKENITQNVYWTGDPSYDFFKEYAETANTNKFDTNQKYVLVTMHKLANVRNNEIFENLLNALAHFDRQIVFIMHPKMHTILENTQVPKPDNILFLEALGYGEMLAALKNCHFLLTDSGGLQKEAYYLGKRCIVRRDTFGWTNLVNAGIHISCGSDVEAILTALRIMDEKITSNERTVSIEEFIRPHACQYTLEILSSLEL